MQNMTRKQILDKVIRWKIPASWKRKKCAGCESLTDVLSKLVPLVDKEQMEEPGSELGLTFFRPSYTVHRKWSAGDKTSE